MTTFAIAAIITTLVFIGYMCVLIYEDRKACSGKKASESEIIAAPIDDSPPEPPIEVEETPHEDDSEQYVERTKDKNPEVTIYDMDNVFPCFDEEYTDPELSEVILKNSGNRYVTKEVLQQ